MPQPQTTNQTKVQHQLMKTTETPPPPSSSSSPLADQTSMISELMKKNPELFKDNKPVKIKVMTKDANGKNTVKFITVKAASPSPGNFLRKFVKLVQFEICTTEKKIVKYNAIHCIFLSARYFKKYCGKSKQDEQQEKCH